MSTIVQNYSPIIRAVTIVGTNAIYYAVERLLENEWVTTWSETVEFRPDSAHRSGGQAFVSAAFSQEDVAQQETQAV